MRNDHRRAAVGRVAGRVGSRRHDQIHATVQSPVAFLAKAKRIRGDVFRVGREVPVAGGGLIAFIAEDLDANRDRLGTIIRGGHVEAHVEQIVIRGPEGCCGYGAVDLRRLVVVHRYIERTGICLANVVGRGARDEGRSFWKGRAGRVVATDVDDLTVIGGRRSERYHRRAQAGIRVGDNVVGTRDLGRTVGVGQHVQLTDHAQGSVAQDMAMEQPASLRATAR